VGHPGISDQVEDVHYSYLAHDESDRKRFLLERQKSVPDLPKCPVR
jgi:hypothetical protein